MASAMQMLEVSRLILCYHIDKAVKACGPEREEKSGHSWPL